MIGRRPFLAALTGATVASATAPFFTAHPCTLMYQSITEAKWVKIQGVTNVQFVGLKSKREVEQELSWENREIPTELSFTLHWEP